MRNWNRNRWAWKRSVRADATLSNPAKLLACALCDDHANHETAFCNPKVETLAKGLGKSVRGIQRAIAQLKAAGWIDVVQVRGSKAPPEFVFFNGREKTAESAEANVIRMSEEGPKTRATNGTETAKSGDTSGVTSVVTYRESGDTCGKSGDTSVAIPHTPYKDKPNSNQRSGKATEPPPQAWVIFKGQHFTGNPTPGPRLIPKSDYAPLNRWADWLTEHGFPKLCHLPISKNAGKGTEVYFWVPTKNPPTTPAGEAEAVRYFQTLTDWEAARHAAQ